MKPLERVLEEQGWKQIPDPLNDTLTYANEGWPDCYVQLGGGFSLCGAALVERSYTVDLGCGGDYDKLAKFLEEIGPVQKP
jgi:hypothetical protein